LPPGTLVSEAFGLSDELGAWRRFERGQKRWNGCDDAIELSIASGGEPLTDRMVYQR